MIHVEFNPKTLSGQQLNWWNNWKKKAEAATQEVIDAWEARRKNPANKAYDTIFERSNIKGVWAELKKWLAENFFHNKCAYCETDAVRSDLHAEHYRPKARVTSEGKIVKIANPTGEEVNHPGYFWLAFNWKNLLPACGWCNSGNGKKNLFPIPSHKNYASVMKDVNPNDLSEKIIQSPSWPNIYYIQPGDLDEIEGRLLLHPYFDEPRKVLRFDDFGNVIALGSGEEKIRGELSIEAYNLRDGRIVRERQKEQNLAESKYETAYRFHRDNGYSVEQAKIKAKEAVAGYIAGREPYSAAVMDVLKMSNPKYF